MKKLIVFMYSLDSGGVQKKTSDLISILSKEYDINLVVYDNKNINYEYPAKIINLNIKKPPYDNIIEEIYYTLIVIIKIALLKISIKPIACISMHETPNYINILTKCTKVIINITHIKSSNFRLRSPFFSAILKKIVNKFYSSADHIVCVSKAVEEDLKINFKINKNTQVINNIININVIRKLAEEAIEYDYANILGGNVIITVGRMSYDKCQWKLIRAFSLIKQSIPDSKLVIIGDGPEKCYLQKIVDKLDLQESVFFLGSQRNPYKFMKHAKVFVLTSPYEGYGLVIPEAMACEVPVVCTDCFSSRELLYEKIKTVSTNNIELAEYGVHLPQIKWNFNNAEDELEKEEYDIAEAVILIINDEEIRKHYKNMGLIKVGKINNVESVKKWELIINEK